LPTDFIVFDLGYLVGRAAKYDCVITRVWQWAANIYNEGAHFSYWSRHKEEMVAFEHTSCHCVILPWQCSPFVPHHQRRWDKGEIHSPWVLYEVLCQWF